MNTLFSNLELKGNRRNFIRSFFYIAMVFASFGEKTKSTLYNIRFYGKCTWTFRWINKIEKYSLKFVECKTVSVNQSWDMLSIFLKRKSASEIEPRLSFIDSLFCFTLFIWKKKDKFYNKNVYLFFVNFAWFTSKNWWLKNQIKTIFKYQKI